ncbi:hypothetical protein [Marinobacterium stanieri]|uniref:Uncharacterized protein n=1 Tax=Marinobacterium stanieri TaxID=49186 RepID=A0A1N6VQA2_9GAMM|nr:hypothetical protein [Marinobacterium stanieri]SIQ80033.1 hypothetical protein SAMN05421647_10956 [Marinobacterium stanieri]
MGLIKQEFRNEYTKGTVFVLDYPAKEFREHLVNNTTYSENPRINAAAQVASMKMLRRTIQSMKHGDTRPIRLHTIVCTPLTADNANDATSKQYMFANAVAGAITSAIVFLVGKKMPKKVQDNKTANTGISATVSLVIGSRVRKYIINNIRKYNAGDVDIMTFIEVNGGIGPQYSFNGTYLTLDEY